MSAIVATLLALVTAGCTVANWDAVTPHYTPDTAPHQTWWWPTDAALYSIRIFGSNSFYAVGEAGTILHSVDGKKWSTRLSGTQASLRSIFGTPDGKQLWAVGDSGTILHSSDGEHWVTQSSGVGFNLQCAFCTADGKQLWAVGDGGTILHSNDGEHWAAQRTGIYTSLRSIFGTPEGKQLWAVGNAGTILHSIDGEHWAPQSSGTQAVLYSIFGARYDSSQYGRFMSPDPIGIMKQKLTDPQQWNMYGYTRNNPLRFADPTGMYNCSDAANCDSRADRKTAEVLLNERRSSDPARVLAAYAYGPANDNNGVAIGFETKAQFVKEGNPSHA